MVISTISSSNYYGNDRSFGSLAKAVILEQLKHDRLLIQNISVMQNNICTMQHIRLEGNLGLSTGTPL